MIYELKLCSNGNYYLHYKGILINNPHITFDKFHKEDAESIIGELNHLSRENEHLKSEIENNIVSFKAINRKRLELEKENEQLKQYIYDNLDEDICDVCAYQYLEKSQMDRYYIAKCKKGYDNCSKGTVTHCKDFKFKELKMND